MKLLVALLMVVSLGLSSGLFAEAQQAAAEAQKPAAVEGGREYNYGDFSSQTLATNAWQALDVKDYDAVYAYTNKCIELYRGKAAAMQASLNDFAQKGTEFDYWALNDVGTCYLIKGNALMEQGKAEEAKQCYNTVINDFKYAQCWDPKGWFWKPADAAKDKLELIELGQKSGKTYDFGDYTSMTLTVNAWGALDKKDYEGVVIYTKKCSDLYEAEAQKQQSELKEYATKDKAFNFWALNDVGTCYFIMGEALLAEGDALKAQGKLAEAKKKFSEAKKAYSTIIDKYSFAQCWDPRGWFWKPAVAARGKINKLIAEEGI